METEMSFVFGLLSLQALLGAFDNLWHHEWQAALPQRRSARRELGLHAAREALYGLIFIGLGWWVWHGAWAMVMVVALACEMVITLADFLEEDRSRQLPPFERALHTVLAICWGVFLGVFAPVLWQWGQQPTTIVWAPQGWVSALFTAYGLGVLLWSVRNAKAAWRLQREPAPASAAPQAATGIDAAVLVTGGTGFVGQHLVRTLQRQQQRVIVLSRDLRQARALFGAGVWVVDTLDAIPSETRIQAIVHLAGARVLGRPWTAARRNTLLHSRVDLTQALLQLMRRLAQPPRVLVCASAVGYYGAAPATEVCDENAAPRPGEFQSDLCVALEHEARRAEALGVRVLRLRLGVVLGRGDGAYPAQALAARWGCMSRLGSGRQFMPWVHLDDAVGLINHALKTPGLSGPMNAVAPDLTDQARFARSLAASFATRVRLAMPAWPIRLAGEMSTLLLDGQRAVPSKALASGYVFRHPTLESALDDLAAVDEE
jgi:uncharacterized protein